MTIVSLEQVTKVVRKERGVAMVVQSYALRCRYLQRGARVWLSRR